MEVLYADYKRQHSIDVIKQELIPNLNKIKIEPNGDSSAMAGASATPKSVKVPKLSKLAGLKKPKIEAFSEDHSLPKPKLELDETSPLIQVRAPADQLPGGGDSQIPPIGIETNASLLDLAYKTALGKFNRAPIVHFGNLFFSQWIDGNCSCSCLE